MSEHDFVERLGDELTAAARRQAARRAAGWRRLLPRPLARRAHGRALVLIGAVALVGAGGTAGLLAARGEVGGPPSLTFARLSPDQIAAGVKPLTRPVVFARGRLAYDGRPWQLVGFQTTRGLCIEIDFPREHRAGGCGSPRPRGGRSIDWQAQIAIARLARGLVLGAVDPAAASVRVRHGDSRAARRGRPAPPDAPVVHARSTAARVVHVRESRLLAAMGLRRPFAYYLAELDGGFQRMRAEARDRHGALLARAGVPYAMNDTSLGVSFQTRMCGRRGFALDEPARVVTTLPPPAIRDRLAALRRPQRADDLPPRAFMDRMLQMPFWSTVTLDAVRLLRHAPNGDALYLIPATQRVPDLTPLPGCLRTLAPRQQEREAFLQRRMREGARRLQLQVFAVRGEYGGPATGFYPEAYRHGHAAYGSPGRRLIGMAPDGVARVELRYRDGVRRVVPVVGNVWIAGGRGKPGPHRMHPQAVLWQDEQGRVLRRLR